MVYHWLKNINKVISLLGGSTQKFAVEICLEM